MWHIVPASYVEQVEPFGTEDMFKIMKKVLFLFVLLVDYITAFAFDTSTNFGFNQQKTAEAYQQYVGKRFTVRPAYGQLETWDKSGFKFNESYIGKTYTISKITVKDVTLNNEPNREITVVAVGNDSKRKIKFKGYEEVSVKSSIWSGVKHWPLISWMPIVFTEPFEEYKKLHMGEIIQHDMVKDQYEVIDIFIGKGIGKDYATAEPNVKVKNMRTGETVECLYSMVKTKPFQDALQGSYKTALLKVEKPENASNRYGETKTIQDDGIDKYSYNDSIIDIVIFGTSKQFNFVLKNVSNHSLKIIWNEAAFVGLDGSSSKIMHVGTKFSEREGDQPATTIIKGAKLEDLATPTSNVYYDEGITIGYERIGNGWKKHSMFPEKYTGKEAGEIRLMLPIQVKDVVNEYTFVFKVYYTYDHPELLNAERL